MIAAPADLGPLVWRDGVLDLGGVEAEIFLKMGEMAAVHAGQIEPDETVGVVQCLHDPRLFDPVADQFAVTPDLALQVLGALFGDHALNLASSGGRDVPRPGALRSQALGLPRSPAPTGPGVIPAA